MSILPWFWLGQRFRYFILIFTFPTTVFQLLQPQCRSKVGGAEEAANFVSDCGSPGYVTTHDHYQIAIVLMLRTGLRSQPKSWAPQIKQALGGEWSRPLCSSPQVGSSKGPKPVVMR